MNKGKSLYLQLSAVNLSKTHNFCVQNFKKFKKIYFWLDTMWYIVPSL